MMMLRLRMMFGFARAKSANYEIRDGVYLV